MVPESDRFMYSYHSFVFSHGNMLSVPKELFEIIGWVEGCKSVVEDAPNKEEEKL